MCLKIIRIFLTSSRFRRFYVSVATSCYSVCKAERFPLLRSAESGVYEKTSCYVILKNVNKQCLMSDSR